MCHKNVETDLTSFEILIFRFKGPTLAQDPRNYNMAPVSRVQPCTGGTSAQFHFSPNLKTMRKEISLTFDTLELAPVPHYDDPHRDTTTVSLPKTTSQLHALVRHVHK